jgi:replication factor A1
VTCHMTVTSRMSRRHDKVRLCNRPTTQSFCIMAQELTPGTIQRLRTAPSEDLDVLKSEYVVQILSLKKIGAATVNGPDRYRIIISDGVFYMQAMLATPLNRMVLDNTLARGSIVSLEKLTCNYLKDKRYASRVLR